MDENPDQKKPWYFDRLAKPSFTDKKQKYVYIPAGESELKKIVGYYHVCPVPGYEIGRVEMVYNQKMTQKFELYLDELQEKKGNPAFMPNWKEEDQKAGKSPETIAWRAKTSAKFEELASPYKVSAYPTVKLMPLFHATSPDILDSIFRIGYASLSKIDDGFFGKGLYFTPEAGYAHRVYGRGALLINWIGCFAAYPVIDGDMPKLRAKNNYRHYDAHFVPVAPASNSPHEVYYYPTQPEQKATFHEVVVFQTAAALPWGIVHLQATLLKPLAEQQTYGDLYFQQNEINKPVDKKGNTLLHLAIQEKKSPDYVKTLMEQGADYKIRNTKGKRPIDMASGDTRLFLEQQHRTLKKISMQKIEIRINRLEQKIAELELPEPQKNHTTPIFH